MIYYNYKSIADVYENACGIMLKQFKERVDSDGELNFFAVDPTIRRKGVGTLLLDELEKREKGKCIYLYTDTGCNYQFYESRGFIREETQDIEMIVDNQVQKLTCFLYSKKL